MTIGKMDERRKFKAVLFDIDGTLVSLSPVVKAVQQTCRRMNLPVPDKCTIYTKLIGYKAEDFYPKLFPNYSAKDIPIFVETFYREYNRLHVPLLPSASRTLTALHGAGINVALVSSKSHQIANHGVRKSGLQYFDVLLTANDVKHIKPHPEQLLLAMKRLRVKPSQALMVGDHVFDIVAARRARCKSAGVTTGASSRRELKTAGADWVIGRISDVLKIVGISKTRAR